MDGAVELASGDVMAENSGDNSVRLGLRDGFRAIGMGCLDAAVEWAVE